MLKCMVCGKTIWTAEKHDKSRSETVAYNSFCFWIGWCSDACHDRLVPRIRRMFEEIEDDFAQERDPAHNRKNPSPALPSHPT